MSADDGLSAGEIVIGGMTLRVDDPEAVSWTSPRAVAVAPIEVTISAGVAVTVDAASPAVVLSVEIESHGESERLIAACEPGESVTAAIRAIAAGQQPADAELRLRTPWARKALVAAITRWMPRPVHEGALLLDRAAAYQDTGESEAAQGFVALAAPLLQALTNDAEHGSLSVAVLAELKSVADHAADAVGGAQWGAEIRGYADRIASSAGMSRLDLEWLLLSLQEETDADDLIGTLWEDGEPDEVIRQLVDPAATLARLLKWVGGIHRGLHIAESRADGETVAELSAELSEHVDEHCYEVGRMTAFVADPTTATLLRTATTRTENGIVTATLRYVPPASRQLVYGLYDADMGVCAIRLGDDAWRIIEIDRILLDAWSIHRQALVVQARLGGDEAGNPTEVRERVDDLLAEAQNLVASAQAKLGRLRRRATADRAEALVARSAAIKRYAEVLRSEGSIPEPGSEPLLAELLPSVADPN